MKKRTPCNDYTRVKLHNVEFCPYGNFQTGEAHL